MTNLDDQTVECRSEPPPTRVLHKIVAFVAGRPAGCANQGPWWANLLTATAVAVVAGQVAAQTGSGPTVLYALVGISVGVIFHLIAHFADPTRWHGTCATCGLCSVGAGVEPARTLSRCNRNLERAGWAVGANGKRDHCQAHVGFY